MQQSDKLLSICIPTYNRADFLIKTIDNIARQMTGQVELVISNNDSTDPTDEKVTARIKEYPNLSIRLINQSKNIGFDRNVLAVVAAAQGAYCWLLSDDDLLVKGAVKRVLDLLTAKPTLSVVVVNFSRFDLIQQKITAAKMINRDRDLESRDANEFYFTPTPRSYFYILGTNTITMSIDIFRRSNWLREVNNVKKFIGLNFIHIFILVRIMIRQPHLYYIGRPLVRYLSNNQRSWANDIWRDYKEKFLNDMLRLGYNSREIRKVQRSSINRQPLLERLAEKPMRLLSKLRLAFRSPQKKSDL